jgi:cysteine peptidase B
MNKTLIVLAIIAAVSANFLQREDETMFKFMKFVQENKKEYKTVEEFQTRYAIFKSNISNIGERESYNRFADQSSEEFKGILNLNYKAIPAIKAVSEQYVSKLTMGELPDTHDWREHKAVGPIKDQGQCGSCWAFSAIGNLEGLYAIKSGKQESFSEQLLVDCDDNGDEGCNGGLMDQAFEWLSKPGHGVELSKDYPYVGEDQTCELKKTKIFSGVKVQKFVDINQNEEEIRKALYEHGPLSIAVDASDFQSYYDGILEDCDFGQLNHGVTLVGYGQEKNVKYWIIRNSWGSSWGEDGYIRLARGKGLCGMNQAVSTAVLA